MPTWAENALYMAAVVSLRFNQDMVNFYARLKQNEKPSKVALAAAMRKICFLANTLIVEQSKWTLETS